MQQYIVIEGDFKEGYSAWGPFPDIASAELWVETRDSYYVVLPLDIPEGYSVTYTVLP